MQANPPGRRSLGFVETRDLARGVVVADVMVKTAPVRLTLLAPVSGGRLLIAVDGEVAPVEAAVASGIARAACHLVDALFLADLHPGVPEGLRPGAGRAVGEALGLVETTTCAAAVRAADAALKAAGVRLDRLRLAHGIGGKGFLQLCGPLADVEAAVAAARAAVVHSEFLVGSEIIPAPHADLRRWLGRDLLGDLPPSTAFRRGEMQLARVVGTCVATIKSPGLRGQRLLVIAPLTFALRPAGDPFVAVDTTRAGPGDLVFWVASREAAKALPDPFNPVDAAILGIVDEVRYAPWPGGTP